jgi:uncharacterized coiled-coil DUF342 family protein
MALTQQINTELDDLRRQVQMIHRQITDKHALVTLAQAIDRATDRRDTLRQEVHEAQATYDETHRLTHYVTWAITQADLNATDTRLTTLQTWWRDIEDGLAFKQFTPTIEAA